MVAGGSHSGSQLGYLPRSREAAVAQPDVEALRDRRDLGGRAEIAVVERPDGILGAVGYSPSSSALPAAKARRAYRPDRPPQSRPFATVPALALTAYRK